MTRHEHALQKSCRLDAHAATDPGRTASDSHPRSSGARPRSSGAVRKLARAASRLPLPCAKRLAVTIGAVLFATLASESTRAEAPPSWGQAGFLNQFESDLDDDGSFDMIGGFVRGQFVVRLTDDVHVRMLGSYHGVAYEFDDPPTIAGSEFKPWNTIHVARLNPLVGFELTDRIDLFAGPLVEASLENGADFSNGLKPGGLIGAEFRIDDDLVLGLGIVGVAEIEDDFYLQPVLILDWTPIDRLTIHASSMTTRGGKLEIAWAVTDELEIAGSVSYRRERFRLKERTLTTDPPPPTFRVGSKGVGEDRAVIPAFRVSYAPRAAFIADTLGAVRIDLEAGVALAGDLRIEDRTGGDIQTMGYDPAPTLSLTISIPL